MEAALFWIWPAAYVTRRPSCFFSKETLLLTRTMTFSIKNCGSFNTENRRVLLFSESAEYLFFTKIMCLIKVGNAFTNEKSKSKRMATKIYGMLIHLKARFSSILIIIYVTTSSIACRLLAEKKRINNSGPMLRFSKGNSKRGESWIIWSNINMLFQDGFTTQVVMQIKK